MDKDSRIYIAGHTGMVGSAIVRELENRGSNHLILKTRDELNLLDENSVQNFFKKEKPEYLFLAAAKVGGMKAFMERPAEYLFENLQIQNNVIWQAHKFGVKKLLFLSSSCVYPASCPQPMKEEHFLDGKLDSSNECYAIAKIAGMELCRMISQQFRKNFISCTATNIYGENDSFDPQNSRIVATLIKKFHDAKENHLPEVVIGGTGKARREFLYVDDLANALIFLMEHFDFRDESYFINVGSGEDISIHDLAYLIKHTVGYDGKVVWDTSRPEGMTKKLLCIDKISSMGWKHRIALSEGIDKFYAWFCSVNK